MDSESYNLRACKCDLTYNSTALTAYSVTYKNLLGVYPYEVLIEPGSGISEGVVHYGVARILSVNPCEPVSGAFTTVSFLVNLEAAKGTYTLHLTDVIFKDEDNVDIPDVTTSDGTVTITNQPPKLSSGYVTPSSGNTDTIFEYYVTYSDPDGDTPTTKYVYVDDSPYTMAKISGDYSSGAIFKYYTTLPEISHDYYFYFNDGHGHTERLPASGTYSGPSVWTSTYHPEVTTGAATSVGTTYAVLNGNLDSTGNLDCLVWFEYGTTASYGSSTTQVSKTSTEAFRDVLFGLSPSTTYHFRAAALNSNGADYGADMTFTTSPGAPSIVTAINVSPSTVSVAVNNTHQFTVIARDQYNYPMSGVVISWTSMNTSVGTVSPTTATTGADGTATSTFTALTEGTTTVVANTGTLLEMISITVTPDWNPWEDSIITTEEIQEAVYHWLTDTPINGHLITTDEMQKLITMWFTI